MINDDNVEKKLRKCEVLTEAVIREKSAENRMKENIQAFSVLKDCLEESNDLQYLNKDNVTGLWFVFLNYKKSNLRSIVAPLVLFVRSYFRQGSMQWDILTEEIRRVSGLSDESAIYDIHTYTKMNVEHKTERTEFTEAVSAGLYTGLYCVYDEERTGRPKADETDRLSSPGYTLNPELEAELDLLLDAPNRYIVEQLPIEDEGLALEVLAASQLDTFLSTESIDMDLYLKGLKEKFHFTQEKIDKAVIASLRNFSADDFQLKVNKAAHFVTLDDCFRADGVLKKTVDQRVKTIIEMYDIIYADILIEQEKLQKEPQKEPDEQEMVEEMNMSKEQKNGGIFSKLFKKD